MLHLEFFQIISEFLYHLVHSILLVFPGVEVLIERPVADHGIVVQHPAAAQDLRVRKLAIW